MSGGGVGGDRDAEEGTRPAGDGDSTDGPGPGAAGGPEAADAGAGPVAGTPEDGGADVPDGPGDADAGADPGAGDGTPGGTADADTGADVSAPGPVPDGVARTAASLVSAARAGRFVSVGVVGAAVDTTLLFVLVEFAGLLAEVANAVSIESAILVMFLINDRWTFAGEGRDRGFAGRLLRSHLVRAVGTGVQFAVFVALFRGLDVAVPVAGFDLWLVLAKGAGIGTGLVVNYVFESVFTWGVHQ